MDDATRLAQCSRCGAVLATDAPGGLCPACLLALAAPAADATISNEATQLVGTSASSSDHATVLASASDSYSRALASAQLEPGQIFGPYRIEKLLGKGGMGEVYAAEHLEHGRRLALKVLSHRLADRDDRARFLREGQLAASINHPRSVYIFGSEEIDGAPIITMELVPGGTLKDTVTADGPYAPAAAVDAILDIVSGLDAAHAAGILHRDIKPSNCFVDHDGTVKIGDFGLSISTLAREATERTGVFQGTPQYAAPEQLRGEPLDVRADIYAVGATLYYLIAGRAPFDDADLTTLITRVKDEPPRSPRAISPKVPKGLAAVVLRCLAKDPKSRPASYAALHELLKPFSSMELAPASLGPRFTAGGADYVIQLGLVALVMLPLGMHWAATGRTIPYLEPILIITVQVLYFVLTEGLGSASPGKRLVGLAVVGRTGQRATLAQAAGRAVLYIGALYLALAFGAWVQKMGGHTLGFFGGAAIVLGVWFSTARAANGFRAVHDRLTGTRVVWRPSTRLATPRQADAPRVDARLSHRRIGPYRVVADPTNRCPTGIVAGYDELLRRSVWIQPHATDAPATPPWRRDLNRPGRLRWLGASRTGEAWDAYEGADGAPMLNQLRPWAEVRHRLRDLATELRDGLATISLPSLTTDRVWITRDNRVLLLDWPHDPLDTGTPAAPPSPATFATAQQFLYDMAARTHDSAQATPLPLSASRLLNQLKVGQADSLDKVVDRLARICEAPTVVTRGRRLRHHFVVGAPMGITVLIVLMTMASAPSLVGADVMGLFQLFTMALLGLVFPAIVPGGFALRQLGIAVVDQTGREVSRRRSLWRALIAWSPILLLVVPLIDVRQTMSAGWSAVSAVLIATFVVGGVYAIIHPERGLQDRLAGTWLVPR